MDSLTPYGKINDFGSHWTGSVLKAKKVPCLKQPLERK